jgi:hypothetical protein
MAENGQKISDEFNNNKGRLVGCPIFPPFYIDSQISVHRNLKLVYLAKHKITLFI